MVQNRIFFCLWMALFIPESFSQDAIQPVDQFEFPDSLLYNPNTIETPVQLFILQSNSENQNHLVFGFHGFNINPPDTSNIRLWSKITMDVSSGNVINQVTEPVSARFKRYVSGEGWVYFEDPPQPLLFDMVHDVSSVTVDGDTIFLEDAYSVIPPSKEYPFITRKLEQAGISPNREWIGGLVSRLYTTDSPAGGGHPVRIPTLWDGEGNLVYQVKYPVPRYEPIRHIFNTPSNIQFSPDNRFFIARGLEGYFSVATPNAYESVATIPYPGSFMLDTETLLVWETERDVAFTSDSRFFVTERDSVPTLVNAYQNRGIHVYDIGEVVLNKSDWKNGEIIGVPSTRKNMMLAATFSHDDQWLYIAGIDQKVYVFPSQLPTSHVEGWEANR